MQINPKRPMGMSTELIKESGGEEECAAEVGRRGAELAQVCRGLGNIYLKHE